MNREKIEIVLFNFNENKINLLQVHKIENILSENTHELVAIIVSKFTLLKKVY